MNYRILISTPQHSTEILATDFHTAIEIYNSFSLRKKWRGSNQYEIELQGSTKSTQWSTIIKKK